MGTVLNEYSVCGVCVTRDLRNEMMAQHFTSAWQDNPTSPQVTQVCVRGFLDSPSQPTRVLRNDGFHNGAARPQQRSPPHCLLQPLIFLPPLSPSFPSLNSHLFQIFLSLHLLNSVLFIFWLFFLAFSWYCHLLFALSFDLILRFFLFVFSSSLYVYLFLLLLSHTNTLFLSLSSSFASVFVFQF